jgi:uncharacterized protein (TIGR02453 family)
MTHIETATPRFLTDLSANNNRAWFAENKARYEAGQANAKAFLAELVTRMNESDDVDGYRLYRIYRDVRFSADKSPYNPRFGMSLARRKPLLRGGYSVNIKPDETVVSAGFWGPNAADLAVIRHYIDGDPERFRGAVEATEAHLGPVKGDGVKTAPRGFRKDHSDIDLLRRKQFLFSRSFSTSEATATDFLEEVVFSFRAARPFFDYMSEILTQDLNGVPLH